MKKLIVILLVLFVLLSACGTKDVTTIYRMTCYQEGSVVFDELVSSYGGNTRWGGRYSATLYPSGVIANIVGVGCIITAVQQ